MVRTTGTVTEAEALNCWREREAEAETDEAEETTMALGLAISTGSARGKYPETGVMVEGSPLVSFGYPLQTALGRQVAQSSAGLLDVVL